MIVPVADRSQVAVARRLAEARAAELGLAPERRARAALVATELATNLVKHVPGGGQIAIGAFSDASGSGLELLAFDSGPGIDNLPRAFADGHSTAGSPGTGLGAVRRLADSFAAFSRPGQGTALMARLTAGEGAKGRDGIVLGAVVTPIPGETVCGDAWGYGVGREGPTLILVDGSGHGREANRAAEAALDAFRTNIDVTCTRLMERIHAALAPTRGAAVGVVRLQAGDGSLAFVGIGNVAGAVVNGTGEKRFVSHGGVAGHLRPRMHEFTYPCGEGALVVLHSDGLSARWSLDSYPGLAASHPSLVAAVLYRDFHRARDDASVVALRR